MDTRRPCPCCGHLGFVRHLPGLLRRPFVPGGSNRLSLVEAQRDFRAYGAYGAYGACDQRGRRSAGPTTDDEPLTGRGSAPAAGWCRPDGPG
ncbi:hypothetical protein [Streptomyces sp. NPDC090021]|uniref:hypothetical protein n=1 Tax=Streptomyces sp. NPDC090021 TaxID=3365919 RepID=UPI00381FE3BE